MLGPMENKTYRDYANDIHSSRPASPGPHQRVPRPSRIEAGRYQLSEEVVLAGTSWRIATTCCQLKAQSKGHQPRTEESSGAEPAAAAGFDERAVRRSRSTSPVERGEVYSAGRPKFEVKVGWTSGGGQCVIGVG